MNQLLATQVAACALLLASFSATGIRYAPVQAPFHYGAVHRVAMSDNERYLATAGVDETLRLWGAKGEGLWSVQAPWRVSALHVLSDGEVVAGGYSGELAWFDPDTGRVIERARGHTEQVTHVTQVQGRSLLSVAADGTVREWSMSADAVSGTGFRVEGQVHGLAVTENRVGILGTPTAIGPLALSVRTRPLAKALTKRLVIPGAPTSRQAGLALAENDDAFWVLSGRTLRQVDTSALDVQATVELSSRPDSFSAPYRGMRIRDSQDELVLMSPAGVEVYSLESGKLLWLLAVPSVSSVSVGSSDGRIVFGHHDGAVSSVVPYGTQVPLIAAAPVVDHLAFRPASAELVTAGGGTLNLWNAVSLSTLRRESVSGKGMHRLAFNASGGRLAHTRGASVMIRDGRSLKVVDVVALHSDISALGWSSAGRLAVGMVNGQVTMVPDGESPALTFSLEMQEIHDLAWHPDGTQLYAVSEDGWLVVLSAADGTLIRRMRPPGQAVAMLGVTVHPDGATVATTQAFLSMYDAVQLWDADGAHRITIPTPELSPHDVVFGPRGDVLLTANMSASVDIRSGESGALLQRLSAPGGYVSQVAMSTDRRFIAAAHSGALKALRLWKRVR